MIESKKYPIVTPIMACIFIIVQRVLFSGTAIPQYDQNGTRFYLYSVALGLVAVGGNLLALYMGYHGKKAVGTKPLAKFANFYLLYVFGTLVLNLSLASFSLNIRDYWTILFLAFVFTKSLFIRVFRSVKERTNQMDHVTTNILFNRFTNFFWKRYLGNG